MAQSPKLYRIDIKILTALHEDVMITNAALSELVGLSPGPCLQRVKRMEESGLIAGYQAEIDVHRAADTITIFTESPSPIIDAKTSPHLIRESNSFRKWSSATSLAAVMIIC